MTLDNRRFYEHYNEDGTTLARIYCCPCCGYPTLAEPGGYEICGLCSWEDDGFDGGGPNACGLEEAQGYFRQYLTSYSPTHEYSPQVQTTDRRFVHQDACSPDRLVHKRRLMRALEHYMAESDYYQRGQLWRQISRE